MAECQVCGKVDVEKPKNWTNWTCPQCCHDELWESVGEFNGAERAICGMGQHASAEFEYHYEDGYRGDQ